MESSGLLSVYRAQVDSFNHLLNSLYWLRQIFLQNFARYLPSLSSVQLNKSELQFKISGNLDAESNIPNPRLTKTIERALNISVYYRLHRLFCLLLNLKISGLNRGHHESVEFIWTNQDQPASIHYSFLYDSLGLSRTQ